MTNHLYVAVEAYDTLSLLFTVPPQSLDLQSSLYIYQILHCLYTLPCWCTREPHFDGLAKDVDSGMLVTAIGHSCRSVE